MDRGIAGEGAPAGTGPASGADLEACLRVLAQFTARPEDPAFDVVRTAMGTAHRADKRHRKAVRRDERRTYDHALLSAASRFREELPSTAPLPPPLTGPAAQDADDRAERDGAHGGPVLHTGRRCYVCKVPYRAVDADYHLMCPDCAEQNRERRTARCDLTGRRAVVTGGRIKIGFHVALKLLRDGAEVLVTSRFPRDAARRFAAVADSGDWLHRLTVHGADFLDLAGVAGLLDAITDRWSHLDILVNNAAQTIDRPADYHRAVRTAEDDPLTGPAARVAISGRHVTPAGRQALPSLTTGAGTGPGGDHAVERWFPAGQVDETGEPLDLRPVNSWQLRVDEVSPREWLAVHAVNAFVPFLLTGRLRPLLVASPHPDRYVVQVSAMEGSFSRREKTSRHPHTNMAKAGLNMLTRTIGEEYAAAGIHVSSVDTGWVTDERPHPQKAYHREAGFRPPLDVIDGAARVYDPIVRGVRGEPVSGVFLKDYQVVDW